MDTFLNDWVTANQANCSSHGVGWASCFLDQLYGGAQQCQELEATPDCVDPSSSNSLPVAMPVYNATIEGAQYFYMAKTIYNMYAYFNTYNLAVQLSKGDLAGTITAVSNTLGLTIEPPPSVLDILGDVLSVLSFAFALVSPSGLGGVEAIFGKTLTNKALLGGIESPGEALVRGISASPAIAHNFLPSGTTGDNIGIADIVGNLFETLTTNLTNNVQAVVNEVMTNATLFQAMAADGAMSTDVNLNEDNIIGNVTAAFGTWIISMTLQYNNVILVRSIGTDMNALQNNATGATMEFDTGCGKGYDEFGFCNQWWYDSQNDITYSFLNKQDAGLVYVGALESIFNNASTTPALLIQSAQICNDNSPGAGTNGLPGYTPSQALAQATGPGGIWNPFCISNIPICTWELTDTNTQPGETFVAGNIFSDCPANTTGDGDSTNFWTVQVAGRGEPAHVIVPPSYIGPGLWKASYPDGQTGARSAGTTQGHAGTADKREAPEYLEAEWEEREVKAHDEEDGR